MEEYIDTLIEQAKSDIKKAQERLKTLTLMKSQVSVCNTSVSVREASLMIGITERSVRDWLHSGKLKGQRVGKSYYVDRESIKEVLAGN
jgi:excisionase family DNA binding protein